MEETRDEGIVDKDHIMYEYLKYQPGMGTEIMIIYDHSLYSNHPADCPQLTWGVHFSD